MTTPSLDSSNRSQVIPLWNWPTPYRHELQSAPEYIPSGTKKKQILKGKLKYKSVSIIRSPIRAWNQENQNRSNFTRTERSSYELALVEIITGSCGSFLNTHVQLALFLFRSILTRWEITDILEVSIKYTKSQIESCQEYNLPEI